MTWTIEIPLPIPSGNAIKSKLYGGDRRAYKRLRTDFGWWLRVNARHVPPATGPRRVTITRVMEAKRSKLMDTDNLIFGAKPLLDELVAAGVLVGDAPDQVTVTYQQVRGNKVGTIVEVTDAG